MKKTSVVRCLVAVGTSALLAVGAVLAADVPWTFEGSDARAPESVATSATPATPFVSWTYEFDDDISPARPFSSFTPGFILFVR